MNAKPDRHAMIEIACRWCGEKFMARKERVDKGQSQFCSMEHYREYQKSIGSQRKNIGKENAIIQWDNPKKMYVAYWYDQDMKYHSAGWARWYWELNIGEVPDGFRVSYKDGNSRNNKPDNVCLKTMAEISGIGAKSRGVPKSERTRNKLSAAHSGKTLSQEHRIHIGDATREKWNKGLFDSVHVGENNHHWRGGVKYKDYPVDFFKIKPFVKERDNYMCQICGKTVYRSRHGHVHHIDGNTRNNTLDNLILVCVFCHIKIHAQSPAPPTILAFRSKLEWNQTEETE